ncbi:hypothetical protein LTS18_005071 [Coniosporium uncinatum]|uniref:Uncharacterized protein n=1 Tax=Coniosporium uncinatum TaxID=93489 RepID=A0ACC3DZU9_9PEZI|nr:hypothetical protein LTS18_005071 [Coniosporium uncinatum]
MVIKRFTGMLGKRASTDEGDHAADTPEANASRGVRLFCESGGPNNQQGEEVLHLPVIVEAAESSPQAASAAAYQIRKFLSKDNYSKPYVQYNAVMLIRILSDNPGQSFTRNMDEKFVRTVKELLRLSRDPSVQQIMRETLASMYQEKAYDTNLAPLFQMWNKENVAGPVQQQTRGMGRVAPVIGHQAPTNVYNGHPQEQYQQSRRERGLPSPSELSARIEEAKTSAKLLQQLVQSTAPAELLSNELVKEFAERCQAAQRSLQGYINCTDPPADEDTLQTLIETSEQLSVATSQHQRAILNVRRTVGASPAPQTENGLMSPPSIPQDAQRSATTMAPIMGPVPTDRRRPSNPMPENSDYPFPQSSSPKFASPHGPHPSSASYIPPMGQDAPTSASILGYVPPPMPPPSANSGMRPASNAPPNPTSPYRRGAPAHEDPFSDNHASPISDDFAPIPAQHPYEPQNYSGGGGGGGNAYASPPPPPPQQHQRHHHDNDVYTSDTAALRPPKRHPQMQATPSYLHRQESSGDQLVMHGANVVTPVEERSERMGGPGFSPVGSRDRGRERRGTGGSEAGESLYRY